MDARPNRLCRCNSRRKLKKAPPPPPLPPPPPPPPGGRRRGIRGRVFSSLGRAAGTQGNNNLHSAPLSVLLLSPPLPNGNPTDATHTTYRRDPGTNHTVCRREAISLVGARLSPKAVLFDSRMREGEMARSIARGLRVVSDDTRENRRGGEGGNGPVTKVFL